MAMSSSTSNFPSVYLARHGETAWTITGQHTGTTDLPLTERGEHNARSLGQRLAGLTFGCVLTSPLQRATRTCELAGFGQVSSLDHDLVEWNYGQYEGKTTQQVHLQRPGWEIFRDGCQGGESVSDVAVRANRVIDRIRTVNNNVLLFSHSHFLHVLAARWLGLEPVDGRFFYLGTAALSIVGYNHDREDPVIRLWNDCSHNVQ
jgi:probable phosphoglycerate mutase